ncbi:pyridoxal phosphate-dependent decarboxylase family protein [Rhodopila sp.]|uniref:pyridoxal phosphate-dependent decarboxylase family protein n=1 Tax=Rhodopila sp. TaxID=2480087 RepID=UPI003D0DA531
MSQPLFPPRQERQRIDHALTAMLDTAEQRVLAGAVVPSFDHSRFARELAGFTFDTPRACEATLAWLIDQMEHGLVHVNHPRYFGLFNPSPTFPARCADRIEAAFNPQLATRTTSPAAVDIENHLIAAVAARLGLPTGSGGHFTSGGAEANYTAVLLALSRASPAFGEHGVRAFPGQPVFYASRESHLAWIKIAAQAGLGRAAVRLVATDGHGQLDPAALADAIETDRALDCCPFMIAATAGTTNAGMIDPLNACADLAARYGIWLHVDAAWAGALIAVPNRRHHLAGIERADSVTVDGHKWFATTMGCGMFVTRHPALLGSTFHVAASYMPSRAAAVDPYMSSMQWSRRFLGLRLFLSLAAAGWEGYAAHIEQTLAMSDLLRQQLAERDWRTVNASPAGVLCLLPPQPAPVRPIVERVLASGRAWVSVASFEGREVMRVCVTSGLTTADDVAALVSTLMQAETT